MTKIDDLLRDAASDPGAAAWDALYQEVCHQGRCYPEGFFLLPHLADIAAGLAPADRDNALIFAGQIAVDLDEVSRVQYGVALASLRRSAGEWLSTPTDPQTFVYRLQAVLALEDDQVWGRELDRIAHHEIEVDCPACGTWLFVVFGDRGHFATHEDYATKADIDSTPLLPTTADALAGVGRRLHAMSLAAHQATVAEMLTYVFGRATCTQCDALLSVSDRVDRPRSG